MYTKLNENETKNLRKAQTNKEERQAIANVFGLNPGNKMDLLLLDFHTINYQFCKDNQFSNEKISTFLAIMDFLFHYMLERQLLPEEGFKILKKILDRHSLQRPPFAILIFEEADMQRIAQFVLKSYFRHYSLYEFAFKPRMELVLKCEPFLNNQFNTKEQCNLGDMVAVDQEDADKLKAYLSLFNQQLTDLNLADADSVCDKRSEHQLSDHNQQH